MSKKEIIKELKNLKETLSFEGVNAKKKVREKLDKLIKKINNAGSDPRV